MCVSLEDPAAGSIGSQQGQGGVEESTHRGTEHEIRPAGVAPPPLVIPIHMHACRCKTLQRGKGAKANKKQRTKLLVLASPDDIHVYCCSIYTHYQNPEIS